jgi:hypothetical protein
MVVQSPPSLFIVSLPRSFSAPTYELAVNALGLREPNWTSYGEILNPDRFAFAPQPLGFRSTRPKFVRPEGNALLFGQLTVFLDHVVAPSSFAYRDVTQPFVVARWVESQSLRILKIMRDVAEVAMRILETDGTDPAFAGIHPDDRPRALVETLLTVRDTLAALPGETLDYAALVWDGRALERALARLYPEKSPRTERYVTEEFQRRRDRILKRRASERFHEIDALVLEIEKERALDRPISAEILLSARG